MERAQFQDHEWFATLNLRVKESTAVILHFGARKNSISESGVAIDDPEGLLEWLAKDRAQVRFKETPSISPPKGWPSPLHLRGKWDHPRRLALPQCLHLRSPNSASSPSFDNRRSRRLPALPP